MGSRFTFVYVRRLAPEKRVDVVVEASGRPRRSSRRASFTSSSRGPGAAGTERETHGGGAELGAGTGP